MLEASDVKAVWGGSVTRFPLRIGLVALLAVAAACGDDGDSTPASNACAVTPPSTWEAPDWATTAQAALELRARLSGLTGNGLMRGVETGTVNAGEPELTAWYEGGTPSLASVTSSYFDGVIADAFAEFAEATGAGGIDPIDEGGAWTPGDEGGIWTESSNRAFNEGGLELRQVVDKALFGAALYGYALGLTAGTITPATIDDLAAAFGANQALNPGRSNDPVEANRNVVSANYAYQMGFYGQARTALIAAKAYAADPDCTAERDTAIRSFFRTWEQAHYARFLFYANAAAEELAAATGDAARGDALHELAEGLGLALGLYGITPPESGPMSGAPRLMTDARVADALDGFGFAVDADLGDATTGDLVSDASGFATAVEEAEAVVAEAYALTEEQLQSYRTPSAG